MAKGIMYVDNIRVEFDDEATIMDVCRKAGVEMPNFCFHSDLSVYGACRMCMVEDLDTGKIDAACTTKPKNGMRIRTNTSRLLKYRRMTLELMLASHCRDCTACEKNRSCRLQEMAVRFGIHHVHFKDTREHVPMDFSSPAVTFDLNKCILCGDCVRVCKEVQGMSILHFAGRGPGLHIEAGDDQPISTTHCVSCGQCAAVCTTGAITVKTTLAMRGEHCTIPASAWSSRSRPPCAWRSARPTACLLVKTCLTSSSPRSRSWAPTRSMIRSSARISPCAKSRQNFCAAWKRVRIYR